MWAYVLLPTTKIHAAIRQYIRRRREHNERQNSHVERRSLIRLFRGP